MKWKIPPLNYLRPFEATARLGSTVRAAEELGRTHGAVSRQIKLLEEWLGQRLFRRDFGRLALTDEGAAYHRAVSHVLDLVDRATSPFLDGEKNNVVRVHSPVVFSSRWLIPRMNRFYKRHPHLDIWLSDFSKHSELTRDVCDVAISLEAGTWPDMDVIPLMPDFIFPVCNVETASRISEPHALTRVKLLHASDPITQWSHWPGIAEFLTREIVQGPRLSDPENVLKAAEKGHGVALARGQLVLDEIASGALVRPLPDRLKIENAYWLIRPKYGVVSSAVRSFTSWIREEADLSSKRLMEFVPSRTAADNQRAARTTMPKPFGQLQVT